MSPASASSPDDVGPGAVVVLAAPNNGHAIARSLGRLGAEVHAIYSSALAVTHSRYWHRIVMLDVSHDAGAASVAALAEIAGGVSSVPLLVVTTDDQARFVADHSDELSAHYRLPLVSAELMAQLTDKELLFRLCTSMGVPTPATFFPQTRDEAAEVAATARRALIGKARRTRSTGEQLRFLATTPTAVRRFYSVIDPTEYMLQEYVPRTRDSRWMFNGYFDPQHRCLFGLTALKVREHPLDGGVASLAESRWNARLAAEATQFLQRLRYVGPVDIDYCYDALTDEYKVLDVNPRLGASFRAFVDSRGWDVARVMFADVNGTVPHVGKPVDGRRWLAEHADIPAAAQQHGRGTLGVRDYVASLRGVREFAWLSIDDPRPVVDVARRAARKMRDARHRRALRRSARGLAQPETLPRYAKLPGN